MRIGVNARSLKIHHLETFIELAKLHPHNTFLFIFETDNYSGDLPENITSVVIGPAAKIPFKSRIWQNLKLPAALKKNKADIFISERFICLKTKVPQILMQPDLDFIFQPSWIDKKQISFYKKNTGKFLEKATSIIVNSFFLKKEFRMRFKTAEQKIHVVYPSVKNLMAATHEEKELIKETYAEGNEYFLFKGVISTEKNLVNLLKAFSFFKKRQRSKMQVLITGVPGEKYEEFVRSLQYYKFKNDVKLLPNLTSRENEKILACAYTMVSIPFYESDGIEVIEAMQSAVPLIVCDSQFFKEYCGEAALYVKPENVNDIAEKMMLLFKDEQMRKELIEKGKSQLKIFKDANPKATLFTIIKEAEK